MVLALGLAACGSASHGSASTSITSAAGGLASSVCAEMKAASPSAAGPTCQGASSTGAPPPASGAPAAVRKTRKGPPSCTSTGYAGSSCTAGDGLVLALAHGRGSLRLPGLRAHVVGVSTRKSTSNGRFSATAKGEFVIITLQVTNLTDAAQSFSGLATQTQLRVGLGTYSESFAAENGATAGTFIDPTAIPIKPGKSETGKLIYDVAPGVASAITTNPSAGLIVGKFGDDLTMTQLLRSPVGFILLKGA